MNVFHLTNRQRKKQAKAVSAIAHNFFDKFGLKHCDEQIWELVNTYISQPDGQMPMARYRASTIYFCHEVLKLLRELSKVNEQDKDYPKQLRRA